MVDHPYRGVGRESSHDHAGYPLEPARSRPFVGRARETALLSDALRQAREGRPQVVLVQGPAGIGKSALMRTAIARAGDARVLWAGGDETEEGLALGVVDQLVAGISPLPTALAGIRDPGRELDLFTVGAALLELLGELQDGGPVVLAVDDAHWADSASLHALVFCLRRLRADRVSLRARWARAGCPSARRSASPSTPGATRCWRPRSSRSAARRRCPSRRAPGCPRRVRSR
ncbi:MAG: ATP-binding protein [Pseudonocardiaceae bacterium]